MLFDEFFEPDGYDGYNHARELVELRFLLVLRETDAAWYIRFPMKDDLTNDDLWFPKSQCSIEEEAKIISVPQWLVDKKECEEYEV